MGLLCGLDAGDGICLYMQAHDEAFWSIQDNVCVGLLAPVGASGVYMCGMAVILWKGRALSKLLAIFHMGL